MKIWSIKVLKGGRITLPAEVRRSLKLEPGDKIRWTKDDDGNVVVTRAPKKEAVE